MKDRTAAWNRLSQNLETSLIRLLPCDAKVTALIGDVSKASEARLAAIKSYLEAAKRQAVLQSGAAKELLASAQGLDADLSGEKSDLGPDRAALAGQIANLTPGAQRQASFGPALDVLKQIQVTEQQRSDSVDSAMGHAATAAMALNDLVVQLQARQAALNDVQSALDAESARWGAYYSARLARAQTECTITRGAAAPAGKKK